MGPESETLSVWPVCDDQLISHDWCSSSILQQLLFNLSLPLSLRLSPSLFPLFSFTICLSFSPYTVLSFKPFLHPFLHTATLFYSPQSPSQPQFPAPHSCYYSVSPRKCVCVFGCVCVGGDSLRWRPAGTTLQEPIVLYWLTGIHTSYAHTRIYTHSELWKRTNKTPNKRMLTMHSVHIHIKTQGHTLIQVHSLYITNTCTHTLTGCFHCVIGVLAGTVAVGESVLETQSRLRLAKQIITFPHWHTGFSQHMTRRREWACACVCMCL